MNQFLKDHQLNKAEFGMTDGSISVWISGPQDKNPSIKDNEVETSAECFDNCYLEDLTYGNNDLRDDLTVDYSNESVYLRPSTHMPT